MGGMMSTLSVGETGLRGHAALTDARGSRGATAARGSGLTTVRSGRGPPSSSSSVPRQVSLCMASELRMTRKWVLSDGVMVTVFSASGFSFLLT